MKMSKLFVYRCSFLVTLVRLRTLQLLKKLTPKIKVCLEDTGLFLYSSFLSYCRLNATFFVTGSFLSMGYGFVEFKDKKEALNAVKELQVCIDLQ